MDKFTYICLLSLVMCSCTKKLEEESVVTEQPQMPDFVTTNPIVHDPVMAKENGVYYLFSTGRGINMMMSTDLDSWRMMPPCLEALPDWLVQRFPEASMHLWAPDIFYHQGLWHLFYSSSAFAKNTSIIAHLTSPTLVNPAWKDCGMVVQSVPERDMWNAIDPNIVKDADGKMWMVFGSFWDGIMLVRMSDDLSGIASPEEWHRLVHRYRTETLPVTDPGDGAVEAPFIFQRNGWYYLFVSFDYCCRGKESTYKVAVGRSRTITGPYLDKDGVAMTQGGGSVIAQGDGHKWQAMGHCAVYSFDGRDMFICHAYDVEKGAPHLLMSPVTWQSDWPVIQEANN